jgi:hypothetical protein
MSAPVYLASCAACAAIGPNGQGVTTYACEVPQPDPFYCRKCRPGLIPADEIAQVDEVVGLLDQRSEARWVVLAREGDIVSIRPLGLPNFAAHTVTVGEISPKFSYERLATARRK